MTTKQESQFTKHKHSSLLGFLGKCKSCGGERVLCYASVDSEMKELMDGGVWMLNFQRGKHNNCQGCVIRHGCKGTVYYRWRASKNIVQRDLDLLLLGGNWVSKESARDAALADKKVLAAAENNKDRQLLIDEYLRKNSHKI